MKERIKVYLYNRTVKEIDLSDFTCIREELFSNRTDFVKIELPEGVVEICDYAFEDCTALEEVVCPASLKKIGKEAFNGCHNLRRIKYGDNVDVDVTAFNGCYNLVR